MRSKIELEQRLSELNRDIPKEYGESLYIEWALRLTKNQDAEIKRLITKYEFEVEEDTEILNILKWILCENK